MTTLSPDKPPEVERIIDRRLSQNACQEEAQASVDRRFYGERDPLRRPVRLKTWISWPNSPTAYFCSAEDIVMRKLRGFRKERSRVSDG
jgi:hypothetical protein